MKWALGITWLWMIAFAFVIKWHSASITKLEMESRYFNIAVDAHRKRLERIETSKGFNVCPEKCMCAIDENLGPVVAYCDGAPIDTLPIPGKQYTYYLGKPFPGTPNIIVQPPGDHHPPETNIGKDGKAVWPK